MMRTYGLIGQKLGHSFSKKYFTHKFEKEQLSHCHYELFELPSIQKFPDLLEQQATLCGLNVTIPYKLEVIAYLDDMDELARKIGAVNVIKFREDGKKIGYNSDCIGFSQSLLNFIPSTEIQALVLGTGGASKAVRVALEQLAIPYQLVSRTASEGILAYEDIHPETIAHFPLIINTTPLGMSPNETSAPLLPYESLTSSHYLYDLVYNPEETTFMKKGLAQGAKVKNGMEMLHLQAEAAWDIWNQEDA